MKASVMLACPSTADAPSMLPSVVNSFGSLDGRCAWKNDRVVFKIPPAMVDCDGGRCGSCQVLLVQEKGGFSIPHSSNRWRGGTSAMMRRAGHSWIGKDVRVTILSVVGGLL